jgi:hypothetical protein
MSETTEQKIERIRDEAFAGVSKPLWVAPGWFRADHGPAVLPLTWERLLFLLGEQNPIATGGPLDKRSTVRALFIMSPSWSPEEPGAWRRYRKRRIGAKRLLRAALALRDHIDEAFFEAPARAKVKGESGAAKRTGAHWFALTAHKLASDYGWTLGEIKRLPVAATFAMLACEQQPPGSGDARKRAPRFSPAADKANGERLRELNKRAAEGRN